MSLSNGPTGYAWRRYWHPADAQPKLDNSGYFYDPEAEWGHIFNPEARLLSELDDMRCLILLGEPGAGKSTAVAADYARARDVADNARLDVAFVDLSATTTDVKFVRDVFET